MKMLRIVMLLGCMMYYTSMNAQEKPFEGEIITESFFQTMGDQQLGNMLGNGVHIGQAKVKGCKIHSVDMIGDIHTISDACSEICVEFIPAINLGMDFSDIMKKSDKQIVKNNTVSKKSERKKILGHDCVLYEGKIVLAYISEYEVMGEKSTIEVVSTEEIKCYVAEDIIAPEAMNISIPGFKCKGMPLQWRIKTIVGTGDSHDSGSYSEHDVIKITPCQISDKEFDIPKGMEILKMDYSNLMAGMNTTDDISDMLDSIKKLKKEGNKLELWNQEYAKRKVGAENSRKTTGVHYKTEGEWDF